MHGERLISFEGRRTREDPAGGRTFGARPPGLRKEGFVGGGIFWGSRRVSTSTRAPVCIPMIPTTDSDAKHPHREGARAPVGLG